MTTLINPGFYSVNVGATVTPPAVKDPFRIAGVPISGFLIKLDANSVDTLAQTSGNASWQTKVDDRIAELDSTNVRGWQVGVSWPLCLTSDFAYYNNILDKLPEGKYVCFQLCDWREFGFGLTGLPGSRVLPSDLASITAGSYTGSIPHTMYKYIYADTDAGGTTVKRWNLKLANPYLQTRLLEFYQAFADQYGNDERVKLISTTESAANTPVQGWGTTDPADMEANPSALSTQAAHYAARTYLMQQIKAMFPTTIVMQDANSGTTTGTKTRSYVTDWYAQLGTQKFGVTTSNANWEENLYNDPSTTGNGLGSDRQIALQAVGNLRFRVAQFQGDDSAWIFAHTGSFGTYAQYQARYTDGVDPLGDTANYGLDAHVVIVQRNSPWWLGGSDAAYPGGPRPSYRDYINSLPANTFGGLNTTEPVYI